MDFQFHHPFSAIISGSSSCGKSTWIHKLLKERHRLIENVPKKIIFCYKTLQPLFKTMTADIPEIVFHHGLPDNLSQLRDTMIFLDDLMLELDSAAVEITEMYTIHRHHSSCSICICLHNIFEKSKCLRTISLNSEYIIMFRNLRDRTQIRSLALQSWPNTPRFLTTSFEDICSKGPYSYAIIDYSNWATPETRVRTGIFSDETLVCYVPK